MANAMKWGLFCAAALMAPTELMAQTTIAVNGGQPRSDTVASPAAPRSQTGQPSAQTTVAGAPASNSGVLGEIIVTAQRRAENLQTVPVAITAVSAGQLVAAGVTDLQALNVLVPGLSFSSIQQNVQPRLRGIGSSTAGPGIEPSVAVYVDGVYYASATGALFSFNNVEQVSVLKGPQGTLFGRNAVAGLVQVTTRDPTQVFKMEGTAGYGNYGTETTSFYVAGGLTDNITADLALVGTWQGEGYGRNLTLNTPTKQTDHDINARSKWIFTPTPSTKITLSMDYSDLKGNQGTDRLEKGSTPAPGTGPDFGGTPWDVEADTDGFNNNKSGGLSLKIDQKLGSLNFLSITAFRKLQYENALDLDFTATPNQSIRQSQHDEQFSQELQLQSSAQGPFKWTTGLFYFNADDVTDPLLVGLLGTAFNPAAPVDQVATIGGQKTQSVAAYGQSSYTFSTATTLTVGGRYTYETRVADTSQTLNFAFGIPSVALPPSHESAIFTAPTFRVSVDQKLLGDVLAYASVNTGFKSGGFDAQQLDAPEFKPEHLTAYETGLKTTLFDRRMTLDGSIFYYDYTDIQIQKINPDGSLGIVNGAKARAYGLDLDVAARVTSALQVTGGLEALNTKFLSFPDAQISTTSGGTPTTVGSATGNQLPLAPAFTGTIGGNYTIDLASGAKWVANSTVSYNSGWYTEPDNARRQPSFVEVAARLVWTARDAHLNVAFWGANLTDAAVRTNSGTTANGNHYVSFAPPRTFGFTVGYKY